MTRMPTLHVQLSSALSPSEVLRILTDFGPTRSQSWAGVDDEHLLVHELGDSWADVTEGNRIGWERERYSWDAEAGTVQAVTTESNLWGPGSRWDYKLSPHGSGTLVDITVQRNAKNVKGTLIGALMPLIGQRMLQRSFSSALKRN
jgi:hypothetical protein